jgi:cell division protein FtsA
MSGKKQEVVSFDIGSSKIAIIIGMMDDEGHYEVKNRFVGPSQGIRSSLITNLSQAEESIISSVLSLEKTCKNFVKQVAISVCSSCAESNYVSSKVRVAGQNVTKQDVQKLISRALVDFSETTQQVIHFFPMEFTLDGSSGITDPVGLLGKELSCNLHIISIDINILNNLLNCLNKCQIHVKDIVLSIYASGLGCTTAKERQSGALVVDFGDRVTSFGVLLEEKLIYFGCVPIGSWHITSDIAKAFSISLESSQKLKTLYGSSAVLENSNMINLEEIDKDEFLFNQVISVSDLSAVINPRVEEIFTLLKEEYGKLKVDDLIAQNMIITGQGSLLNNLAETVGDIFSKTVKIDSTYQEGEPKDDLSYTTALGIIEFKSIKKKEGLLLNNNAANNSSFLKRMFGWLKENI